MPETKPTEEQTNTPATEQVQEAETKPATEQTTEQANTPAKKQKKLDKKSIITIVVAFIGFLAILFGVLAACGVFNKNTPEDNTDKITITIEVNGGTGNYNDISIVLDENNTYTFTDEEIAAIKDALTKDGYELKGLSTTPDGEGGWTVTIPKDAESPVKLYAIWEENEPQPELAIFTHEGGVITGLTDYGKTLSTITIPGTLDGEQITGIRYNAFRNNETITGVTIPNTVTSIGTGAFSGCKGLTNIKIPDGITSITHDVFSQCSSLKSIEIPSSLTNVGHGAFYGCTLTAVYFNGTSDEWNVYIDNSAVSNGNFTTEIVYYYSEKKPTEAGKFWHYVNNVPTVWEVNIQPVEKYTITFNMHGYGNAPEDITDATALPAELPTVADDGEWYLAGWYLDEEYNTEATAGATISADTTLHAKWESKIFTHGNGAVTGLTEYGKTLSTIIIPSVIAGDEITKIGAWAFFSCSGLEGVTIPSNITSIAEKAFSYCTGLTSIEIPNSVTNIGTSAFAGCENLTNVTLPNGITSIVESTFSNCTGLESVTIPSNVTSIGDSAFSHCTSLTSIEIPSNVTSIGNYAFEYCSGITSIIIPSNVTSIGYNAFKNCTWLTSVTIPNSVTSLQASTFRDCTSLESITIPNSVESLGHYTFMDCTGLISVIIPSGLTSIGYGTFDGCTGLTTVYYGGADSAAWSGINIDGFNVPLTTATRYYYSEAPEVNSDGTDLDGNYWHYVGGVPTIWTYADRVFTYNGNTVTGLTAYAKTLNLTKITIPSTINGEQITSIGNQAFSGNTTITSVTIQNGITSIDSSAFTFCHGLTSVTIPNSVTSIGSAVFSFCENLTTVALPDGIMSVPYLSFGYCTSLESVIIPGSVTSIESSAFGMIDSLITVYFKGTSAEWGGIEIGNGNTAITNGTKYYYSETKPTEEGNFWHDVGGVPKVWGADNDDELASAKAEACTTVEDYANEYIELLDENIEAEAEMIAAIESVRDNAIAAIDGAQNTDEIDDIVIEAMFEIDAIVA